MYHYWAVTPIYLLLQYYYYFHVFVEGKVLKTNRLSEVVQVGTKTVQQQ